MLHFKGFGRNHGLLFYVYGKFRSANNLCTLFLEFRVQSASFQWDGHGDWISTWLKNANDFTPLFEFAGSFKFYIWWRDKRSINYYSLSQEYPCNCCGPLWDHHAQVGAVMNAPTTYRAWSTTDIDLELKWFHLLTPFALGICWFHSGEIEAKVTDFLWKSGLITRCFRRYGLGDNASTANHKNLYACWMKNEKLIQWRNK